MGLLQNGQWVDEWYDTKTSGGEFRRQDSQLRSWVTTDGAAGPTGSDGFISEPGRYQLYVSLACPWAHRTLIFRQLKELQDFIDVAVVEPLMLSNGWELKDDQYGLDYMYQLYLKANPDYEGRVTVPVLWDKQTQSIVSNESADIIRMLNSAFNGLTGNDDDYYPADLRAQIDSINECAGTPSVVHPAVCLLSVPIDVRKAEHVRVQREQPSIPCHRWRAYHRSR